jgi:hypothetical protein
MPGELREGPECVDGGEVAATAADRDEEKEDTDEVERGGDEEPAEGEEDCAEEE